MLLYFQERRIHAISELVRVLRPGGQALVYVWAMEQEINKVKSKYLKEKEFDGSPSVRDDSNSHGNGCKQTGEDSNQQHISDDSGDISSNSNHQECDVVKSDNSCQWTERQTTEICDENSHGIRQNSDSKMKTQTHFGDNKQLDSSNLPNKSSEQYGKQPKELVVHKNRTNFQQQDLLVPWQLKGGARSEAGGGEQVFHRFYHVFQRGELERLCGHVTGCQVVNGYYDQGNWAVILQKM